MPISDVEKDTNSSIIKIWITDILISITATLQSFSLANYKTNLIQNKISFIQLCHNET